MLNSVFISDKLAYFTEAKSDLQTCVPSRDTKNCLGIAWNNNMQMQYGNLWLAKLFFFLADLTTTKILHFHSTFSELKFIFCA